MASTISCLVATAMAPSAPPSASEPVSPMKIMAGRRVEPQEAEAGADQGAADDGKLAGALHVVDLQVAREVGVARQVGDQAEGGGGDHHRHDGEAVEAVGEVDGVAGAGDDEDAEQDEQERRAG